MIAVRMKEEQKIYHQKEEFEKSFEIISANSIFLRFDEIIFVCAIERRYVKHIYHTVEYF